MTNKYLAKCSYCHIEFMAWLSSSGKYCSMQCQVTARQKKLEDYQSDRGRGRCLRRLHGNKCFQCGILDWRGQPLLMELDHIDGNHLNNTKENLRLLCPNCHAQTPTYKNKNKGRGRPSRRSNGVATVLFRNLN